MSNSIIEHINKKIESKKATYKIDVNNIIEAYNHEQESMEAYKGRELLELLQNADDELNDLLPKEVKISLVNNKLCIANYGDPFSNEGIDSLMWSNLSAKRKRLKETIGCKGTGFRSILGWSKSITIDSGELHIRFSEEHSQNVLKELYKNNLTQIKKIKAPTLVFPEIVSKHTASEYTTNICIEIIDEDAKKDIEAQLNNIESKILLFLNRIEVLKIETKDKKIKYTKTVDKNNVTIKTEINNKEAESQTWYVKTSKGELTQKNKKGEEELRNYSISIAYNPEDRNKDNILYSFFPTDVDFPFPILLHATFELNPDRNHLTKKSAANKYILEKCFELLVSLSLEINKKPNYDALSFVINDKDFVDELKDYNCDELLKSVIVKNRLFPSVNNEMLEFDESTLYFYTSEFPKYLNGEYFDNLLQCTNDNKVNTYIKSLFKEYGSTHNEEQLIDGINEWVTTLLNSSSKINTASMKKIAHTLIYGTQEELYYQYRGTDENGDEYTKYLQAFVDVDGNLISAENSLFLNLSSKRITTKIPSFVGVEFLNSEFSEYLKELSSKVEGNAYNLNKLNINEYDFSNIITSMNEKISDEEQEGDVETAKKHANQMLQWLWKNKKNIIDFDDGILIQNKNGNLEYSDGLYYGSEYGNSIIDKLIDKDRVVANIRNLIDVGDAKQKEIIEFLEKIGTTRLPRKKINRQYMQDKAYIRRLLDSASYPIDINNRKYKNSKELADDIMCVYFEDYIINDIDEILKNSTTKDILDWILLDHDLQTILYSKNTINDTNIDLQLNHRSVLRPLDGITKPISFTYNSFYTNKWIEQKGQRFSLGECFKYDLSKVNLFPHLIVPKGEDYVSSTDKSKEELIKKYNDIFNNLDINDNFSKLSTELIYETLYALPSIDNSSAIAKTLYLDLVKDQSRDNDEITCEEYIKFTKNGEVLCNTGYKKISQAHYSDVSSVPKQLSDKYNLLCLSSRRSAKRVEHLLGVKRFKIKEELVGEPIFHEINSQFINDFNKFKVLAYCYRIEKNKEDNLKLNKLNIYLCSEVKAKINEDIVNLDDYEHVQIGNSYYIKAPTIMAYSELFGSYFSNLISEIMCNYLNLSNDSSSAKPFRELYSKGSDQERRVLIEQDFEDETIILKAMDAMDSKDFIKDSFNSALKKAAKADLKDYQHLISALDYENINIENNAPIIIELFRKLGIDIEQYNKQKPDTFIDLTSYYKNKLISIKTLYKDKYKAKLFTELKDKGIDEKSLFLNKMDEYDIKDIKIENSVNFNVEELIIKDFGINKNQQEFDFVELNKQNLGAFKQIVSNANHLDTFFNDKTNLSLLYFAEYDYLKGLYEKHIKQLVVPVKDEEVIITSDETLVSIDVVTSPLEQKPNKQSKPSSKKVGYEKKDTTKREELGLKGELSVYNSLLKNKDYSNVNWVSENAQKAGVNPEGAAGKGYDIEFIDKNGDKKYIEVKTTSLDDGTIHFDLSDNEFNFGISNYKNYEIYYVVVSPNSNPIYYQLKDLFKDGAFNTSSYSKESSSYKITAKIN